MEVNKNKIQIWLRESITLKMFVVGFLFLVLLIPLVFAQDLIAERKTRQKEVISEINEKWGTQVTFTGPIIKVPYKTLKETRTYNKETESYDTKNKEVINYAYFLPEEVKFNSKIASKPLKRSIYKSVVFTSETEIDGNFSALKFEQDIPQSENILWSRATVILQTSNLKGIRNNVNINLDGNTYQMNPVYDNSTLHTLESEPLKNLETKNQNPGKFHLRLEVNGSESLRYIPVGRTTLAHMESDWKSPKFNGMFLPEDGSREITSKGFKADWKVLQINRQFEQTFYNHLPDLSEFAFGSDLIIPVNEYVKSERASKYGAMIIGLTLLVFLLIQLVSRIYIHPFQYVMIGLALIMFYTLLISISEHSSFVTAYFIAAASVITLITLYSRTILKGYKFSVLIAAALTSLYGFLYIILQLEDYALLVGSIGLFAILAIVMFATKKIDWNRS